MHNYHLLCPIDTQTMSLWLIDHWKPLGHVFPPSSPPLFHASSFFPTHYSVPMLCPALRESMDCSTPGSLSFTISQSLLKLMSIELVMPSNHLILCQPLLLLPSIFPSIMVFSNELALCIIRWPKHWSFRFCISPSSEYSGLTSFRIDWFVLLAVQT